MDITGQLLSTSPPPKKKTYVSINKVLCASKWHNNGEKISTDPLM